MQAEHGYRLLVHGVHDYAIFMLDPDGRIASWNTGAERIKGYREDEVLGKHFSMLYPPEDVAAGKPDSALAQAVLDGRVEDEGWRLRKDGSRFWANVVITALYDEKGSLYGFGKVTRDMTERRAAEDALRDSEERFRLLVRNVLDYGVFMLDPDGHVASWNIGAERIEGYESHEIVGQHFSVFYPPDEVAAGKPNRALAQATRDGRAEDEGWRLRKDGSRFWAKVMITPLFDDAGTLRGFGKVTQDLTERRATEQALTERRRLLTHLVEAQELERRRIAWDVHDDSIQAMVAIGMRLQLLAGRVDDELRPGVTQLEESVRGAISRLRNLVVHLRPTAIEEHGLVAALNSYLTDVVTGWDLLASLDTDLDREPPAPTAITIFRICQEALTNVRKHARASRVTVTLTGKDDGTLVRIADDGVGLPGTLTKDTYQHFGLIEMRERAETAGGWWSVGNGADGGVTVEFWLPAGTPSGDGT